MFAIFAKVTINTVVQSFICYSVLGSKFSHNSNDISTTVLGKCSRDDFQCACKCFVWPLLYSFNFIRFFQKSGSQFHFDSTTTWYKFRVHHYIAGYSQGIMKVSFNFIEYVF